MERKLRKRGRAACQATMQTWPWMQEGGIEGWVEVCEEAKDALVRPLEFLGQSSHQSCLESPRNRPAFMFLSHLVIGWEQPMDHVASAQVQWNSKGGHGLKVNSIPVVAGMWCVFSWLQQGMGEMCRTWHSCLTLMEWWYMEMGDKSVLDKRSRMNKNKEAGKYGVIYGKFGVFHLWLKPQVWGYGYRLSA